MFLQPVEYGCFPEQDVVLEHKNCHIDFLKLTLTMLLTFTFSMQKTQKKQ